MFAAGRFSLRVVALMLLTGFAWLGGVAQGKGVAYVNLAAVATTWAVGQNVPVDTVVESGASSAPAATGTVQFYASGLPVGAPISLTNAFGTEGIAIQTPGSYVLTANYSGDANYAPVSSTYSWPITVEYNPSTLLPVSAPASLSFAAGATTGNTLTITLQQQGGCGCGADWNTSIGPAPGTTLPANPPSLTFAQGRYDGNGNWVYPVAVVSTAPRTVTTSAGLPGIGPLVLACVLLPIALRRSRAAGVLFSLVLLGGCAGSGSAPKTPTPATTTIPGSAGSYVVTITGSAFTFTDGYTYFSLQVPVTIQ